MHHHQGLQTHGLHHLRSRGEGRTNLALRSEWRHQLMKSDGVFLMGCPAGVDTECSGDKSGD